MYLSLMNRMGWGVTWSGTPSSPLMHVSTTLLTDIYPPHPIHQLLLVYWWGKAIFSSTVSVNSRIITRPKSATGCVLRVTISTSPFN